MTPEPDPLPVPPPPQQPKVQESVEQLRWSLERTMDLLNSYIETQRHLDRKAYSSAAAFAVVLAVGLGMCPTMTSPWGVVPLVLLCLSALLTVGLLWKTSLVKNTDDFNAKNFWDTDVAEYDVKEALRYCNTAAQSAAQEHLDAAQYKAKWATLTQVAALGGIVLTVLTAVISRISAL
jgi:hypothetical protein